MTVINDEEKNKILSQCQLGFWRIEKEPGKAPRLYADEVLRRFTGSPDNITPEERFIYHHEHVHKDDVEMFTTYALKLGSDISEIVFRYIHPTKGELFVRCSGRRDTSFEDYEVLVGWYQNISKLQRIERGRVAEQRLVAMNQELKREQVYSDQLLSSLVRIQVCGILSYKIPSYEILVMNDMARKMYDFEPTEELTLERIAARNKNIQFENEEEKKKLMSLRNPGDQCSYYMKIPHKDRTEVHIYATTQLVEMDNGDRVIVSSLQDISALTYFKEYNAKLKRQLDIIQSFGRAFNASYYINLKTKKFLELSVTNENIAQMIGDQGDAEKKLAVFADNICKEHCRKDVREFLNLDTVNARLKDREWIMVEFDSVFTGWNECYFIAANRDDHGNCDHIIFATRNIDEKKRRDIEIQDELKTATENAIIANKSKSTFLFNMSHDIRTPMNAIMGFAKLLRKYGDSKEKRDDYLDKIESAGEFLLSLINNVLEMARIESGKASLDENVVNISEMNHNMFLLFEEQMKNKGIEFIAESHHKTEYIYCDELKAREVFLNILSNAYKYTPSGGKIMATIEELESEIDGYAVMQTTIEDTGIGMAKEYLPHIFDEFTRERTATDSKVEGTGLGMPIVKKLIDLMGGTIEVESELGKGTKFVITIGFRIAEGYKSGSSNSEECDISNFEGKRILLAEDNELNAEIAMELLGDYGFEIEHAEDGIICVDMLTKAEPGYYDLILMDIQMPNLNGYDATKRIRSLEDQAKATIPILAMTANAFDEDKRAAVNAGMNGHLSKPIMMDELQAELGMIFNKG